MTLRSRFNRLSPSCALRTPSTAFREEEVDVSVQSGGTRSAKPKKSGNTAGLTPDEAARITALMRDAKVERVAVDAIQPNLRNARRHPPKQIATLAENIRQFGFTVPVLVDEHREILAGHGRHAAARLLGLPEIPVIRLTHLNSAEKRALAVADNRIAELGSWDPDQLKETLALLVDPSLELSFDLDITGFDTKEIHTILRRDGPPELRGDGRQHACMVQADCCSTLPRCQNLLVHRLAERRCADESGGAGDWRPERYGRLGPIRCYARPTLSITLRPGGRVHGSRRRTVQAPSTWAPSAASHERLGLSGGRSGPESAHRPEACGTLGRRSQGLLVTRR